jgi:magnesium transporter
MLGRLRRRRAARRRDQLAELLPRTLTRLIANLTRTERDVPQPRRGNPDAVVDCAVYQQGARRPRPVHYAEAARQAHRHRGAFVWLGLHEPDRATMRSIADAFDLHELTLEQALAGGHRPAVESIGDVTRLVLRTARYVEHEELTATSEVVDTGDVTVLIGPRFVITVRHGAAGVLWPARQDLEQRSALLAEGPWSVGYAVCSRMVDLYLEVAGHVERDLERLEEDAFATMRKIASWAAIAAVPTVIGGVYGMNFRVIPGLAWRYGFPTAVLVMIGAAVFLYGRLKKVGWL